jgi:hypothetical protein
MLALPHEMIDRSIGHLHRDAEALGACVRVHSSWTSAAQRHLFKTVEIIDTTTMLHLVETLEHSPHIIPWIKCVALQAEGYSDITQHLCVAMIKNSELFSQLSTLLPQLQSLELREFALDDIGYVFGRTHFLSISHLKLEDAEYRGTTAAFEQDFLLPRPNLDSVSFFGVTLHDSPAHTLCLSKYREVDIDVIDHEGALRLLHALADVSHGPSRVEHFSVLLVHTHSLPSICKALRATGLSLRTFRVALCGGLHDHGASLIHLRRRRLAHALPQRCYRDCSNIIPTCAILNGQIIEPNSVLKQLALV